LGKGEVRLKSGPLAGSIEGRDIVRFCRAKIFFGRGHVLGLTRGKRIGKMPKTFPMSASHIRRLIEAIPLDREELAARLGYHPATLYRWERGGSQPKLATLQLLRLMAETGISAWQSRAKFTFIDLFAGIGGMRLGVEAAGGRCIFTCEWDKYARITYEENFRDGVEHPFPEDIWDVHPADVPNHDLLVAGFPCQPFSIAGVSKKNALGRPHGFDDKEQGNLFFKIAEILEKKRPAAFLLENVKNLKSHDKGNTYRTIRRILEHDLRYHVQDRIIDAAGYVPQHRERIFIVGFAQQTNFDFARLQVPKPSKGPKLRTILHPEDGSEAVEPPYTVGPKGAVAEKYVLTQHLWRYLRDYAAKHRAMGNGFGYGLFDGNGIARTLSARYYKDGSEILISQGKNRIPRRLTPRECARLMGFDRPGIPLVIRVSDTRAYKQFGNAVVVPVVKAVAEHLVPHMLQIVGGQQLELELSIANMHAANG
jgi:DNA (cytosine-5)-methyltransferase 1